MFRDGGLASVGLGGSTGRYQGDSVDDVYESINILEGCFMIVG